MEEPIGTGFGGFPIFRVSKKRYRCTSCKREFETDTNHYEPIYSCLMYMCNGPSECLDNDLMHLASRQFDSIFKKEPHE